MRLKGRQTRFLVTTVGGWTAMRAVMLWPVAVSLVATGTALVIPHAADRLPVYYPAPAFRAWRAPPGPAAPARPAPYVGHWTESAWQWDRPDRVAGLMLLALVGSSAPQQALRQAIFTPEPDGAAAAPEQAPSALFPTKNGARRIGMEAYLFMRPGGGHADLSGNGMLGGSQAAARIAVPLGRTLSAVARLYTPLDAKGAEAAAGLDWRPVAGVPARLSVERRERLDSAGRSAWSAYVAGGFYTGRLARDVVLDGYGQAGVVGVRRSDGFADGALRIGYRLAPGARAPLIGAGMWGAAQPGVRRLDLGPRASMRLPVEDHALTLAVEGRLRAAGNARPGSGVAVTLAADW